MKSPAQRGFTLLEMMVVVAIIGIVTAITLGGLDRMRPRVDVNSATNGFVSVINEAKSRALASQGDVWLIVYRAGASAPAEQGGWVIYESRGLYDGTSTPFNFADYEVSGSAVAQNAGDRVWDQKWLVPTPGGEKVKFDLGGAVFGLENPFNGLDASSCSFCTASSDGERGALVFQPDGQVRIVDGEGNLLDQDAAVLTLSSDREGSRARAAVAVSFTGLTRVTKP